MQPTVSQICALHSPFARDLEEFAQGACRSVEIWLGKLDMFLQTATARDVLRLLDEHEIVAPVASFQGGLWTSQGEARREHWRHFEHRLQLCRELRIRTLVVAGDLRGPLDQAALDRALASLAQAARTAGEAGVRLAFEFQAASTFANNLQTAAAVIADVASPHLGLCLDAFEFYIGPSKTEDLGCLQAGNLFHVQFSDLADTPRELASDADRILPGDGDIPLGPIVARLREIGYEGCVSLELMNPEIWRTGALQVGEIGMTALRRVLGMASMD